MATVRNLFHEVGNWHNKISIIAGVARKWLTESDIKALKTPESQKIIAKVIKALKDIEKNAVGADKTSGELKEFIYKKVNPDIEVTSG